MPTAHFEGHELSTMSGKFVTSCLEYVLGYRYMYSGVDDKMLTHSLAEPDSHTQSGCESLAPRD